MTIDHNRREGRLPVPTERTSATTAVKDCIRLMLDGVHTDEAPGGLTFAETYPAFQRLASGTEVRNPSPQKVLTDPEGASPPSLGGHSGTSRLLRDRTRAPRGVGGCHRNALKDALIFVESIAGQR
jgi:hypothetical protein